MDSVSNSAILLEEIKILSNAIIGADKQSNQIKQWCLTLWTACWGLVLAKHILPSFVDTGYLYTFAILLIPVMFGLQDVATKRNQRKLLWRTQVIHSELNRIPGSEEIRQGFRIYDVAGFGQAHNTGVFQVDADAYHQYISPLTAFRRSTSIKCFYSILFLLTLVLSIAVNTLVA